MEGIMSDNFKLDSTILSKELKLLIDLLSSKGANDSEGIYLFKDIDWSTFLDLVYHHRCHPIIYLKLKDMPEKIVPLEVIQTLYQEYKKNTFKMLQLSGEMEQISELFTKNQIKSLFLKGPVVAYDLYGDISLRTSKDLDILIPEKDLDKVETLLLNSGYVKDEVPTILNERKWRKHHIEYFHPQKRIQIEIHWRLHNRPMKEPSFNELWQRKRLTPLTNYPVYFLGEEDLFLHLVVHGARHGWFRLRWLIDIDQIIQKGIDYKKVNSLMGKLGYSHLVGQSIILCSQLLNSPIYKEVRVVTEGSRPRRLAEKAYFYISISKEFTYDISYLFSLKSNVQKLLYIFVLFYPRYGDSRILRLPKCLHLLYFPLKPFLWMWRKVKKPKVF